MSLAYIQRLLTEATGLDPEAIGAPAIERAVRVRQRACRLNDQEEYAELVAESRPELQALIDAVVVAETWFFRDVRAFDALVRFVKDEWLPVHPVGTLRMLSLPCATGEEPYSMAIALLAAGVDGKRFTVDAVDISQRALVHGRQGVFGRNAFRGTLDNTRGQYFVGVAGGSSVTEEVAQKVQFHHGNLFSPSLLPGAKPYDVIFCRNLLIYFDRAAQDRAIDVISGLLQPNGLVFVGPSETIAFMNRGFVSEGTRSAFGLRKAAPALRLIARNAPDRTVGEPAPREAAAPLVGNFQPGPSTFAESERLADQGRFEDAARSCEAHIQQHGPSAQAFYLLGLIHDALGDRLNAMSCYRKVLYLEPRHEEALVHLALLLETLDRKDEAQRLRSRARRAGARSSG